MDMFKLKGTLGNDTIEEMDSMDDNELKTVIVQAETAMQEAKEELEGNENYQRAKADCSLLSSGKKEVDKRQKGKIQYALSRLTEIGKLGPFERMEFEKQRAQFKAKQAVKAAETAAKAAESETEDESE